MAFGMRVWATNLLQHVAGLLESSPRPRSAALRKLAGALIWPLLLIAARFGAEMTGYRVLRVWWALLPTRTRRSRYALERFLKLAYVFAHYKAVASSVQKWRELSPDIAEIVGHSHLLQGDALLAKRFLEGALPSSQRPSWVRFMLAMALLASGDRVAARRQVERLLHDDRTFMDINPLQMTSDEELAVSMAKCCDAMASMLVDQGKLHLAREWYAESRELAKPVVPATVSDILSRFPGFDPSLPTRVLPSKWVSQIGHLGFLDVYRRMALSGEFGQANFVLLAPEGKVANQAFLDLLVDDFVVVRDPHHCEDIARITVALGDTIKCVRVGSSVELWPTLAATAMRRWAAAGVEVGKLKAPLLSESVARRMAIDEGAWWVCLHVREPTFHDDSERQRIRNADIGTYRGLIEAVADRGGKVIRMGRSKTPLVPCPGLVDYASSGLANAENDLALIGGSKAFVGGSSGLTNIAISFDVPTLVVNAISPDWQLWGRCVHFMPKLVKRRGTTLSLQQMMDDAVLGALTDSVTLASARLQVVENTEDELRRAIEFKLDSLSGKVESASASRWQVFGAAGLVPTFAAAHPQLTAGFPRHSQLMERA